MIRVIDRIQYLPKDKKALIDMNEIANEICRELIAEVTKRLKTIPTEGKSATITIGGKVTTKGCLPSFDVNCDDEYLKKAIQQTLNK